MKIINHLMMTQDASRTKWQRLWASRRFNHKYKSPDCPTGAIYRVPTRMLVENEVYSDLVLALTCATILHPEVTG